VSDFIRRKTWIIADTHFNHKKLCESKGMHLGRPDDFERRIYRQCQQLIQPQDLVYHLGDAYLGKKSGFTECINSIPGTKILVQGNHDKNTRHWYLNHGFVAVMDYVAIKVHMIGKVSRATEETRVILSHKPIDIVHPLDIPTINIHGHFHNCAREKWEPELEALITPYHYLFSIERMKWRPMQLERAMMGGLNRTDGIRRAV